MVNFLFQVTLAWLAFALFFELFLKRQTRHQANRFYLILAAAGGFALPFFQEKLASFFAENALPTVVLPTFEIGPTGGLVNESAAREPSVFDFQKIGWLLYWLGVAVGLAGFGAGLRQLFLKKKRGKTERLTGGFSLIRTAENELPCSFFRWIFLPDSMNVNELDAAQIIEHERAHGRLAHSFDVLFLELLRIFFWFHPLAWWFKIRLREVHEFEADAAVARLFNRKQYGVLLMQQSLAGIADRRVAMAVANSFFSSPLKSRIVMLTQKKSSRLAGFSYALVLPLMAGLLFFQQKSGLAQQVLKPGGKARVDTAHVFNPETREEKVMVVKNWPDDTLVTFDPETNRETVAIIPQSETGPVEREKFYLHPEIMPEFPGGQAELLKFLGANVKYPQEAKKAGSEGKVFMHFMVEADGSLSQIWLKKAVPKVPVAVVVNGETGAADPSKLTMHPSLIEEAGRVIRSMPAWKPGQAYGKAVRTEMILPISFRLE